MISETLMSRQATTDIITLGTGAAASGGFLFAQTATPGGEQAALVTLGLAVVGLVTLFIRLYFEDRERKRTHDEAFANLREMVKDLTADAVDARERRAEQNARIKQLEAEIAAKGCKWPRGDGKSRCHDVSSPLGPQPGDPWYDDEPTDGKDRT